MEYPKDCITAKDKTEYLYIAQEKLKNEHNDRVGVLSVTGMGSYIKDDFMPKSHKLSQEICVERAKLSKSDMDEIMGTGDIVGTKKALQKSKRWVVFFAGKA